MEQRKGTRCCCKIVVVYVCVGKRVTIEREKWEDVERNWKQGFALRKKNIILLRICLFVEYGEKPVRLALGTVGRNC